MTMTSGLYHGIPAVDYHAIEALSASAAKLLLRSPAHYWAAKHNPREPSTAMKRGTLVHSLILEPEKFEKEFAVAPKFDRRTTIGKQAAADFEQANAGKIIVDEDQYELAKRVSAAVHERVDLSAGEAEVTMLSELYGVPCKARIDLLKGSTIYDIKTCQDAGPEAFSRQIAQFKYHLQAAHYAALYKEIVGWELEQFVFVAVETEAPFEVACYTLDAKALQSGRILMERAAKAYKIAMQPGAKHGYPDGITELSLPSYAHAEPFTDAA